METETQAAFFLAVRNQSMMRLDALGIKTTMDHLPSVAPYRESVRVLAGYNWITRLWCRRIRPVLFPSSHRKAQRNVAHFGEALKREFWEDIWRQWETGQRR